MKRIMFILDGAADLPNDGKTPLDSVSETNPLHVFAKRSLCGVADTTYPSASPGTDVAICRLFGAKEGMVWGRGALEAADYGITGAPCYLRCNIAAYSDEEGILSHDGGCEGEEGKALMRAICDDEEISRILGGAGRFHVGISFRHLLETSALWEGWPPPHDNLGIKYPSAGAPFDAAFARARAVLEAHPFNIEKERRGGRMANVLWPWGGGAAPKLDSFVEKYGERGACVSAVPVVNGIGRLVGLDIVNVPGATGWLDTNWRGKADAVLESDMPFALLHIEAPDECSHNGTREGKEQAIKMGGDMLGRLVKGLDAKGEDYRILFLSDHVTALKSRGHERPKIPFAIYDSRKAQKGVRFTELDCAKTGVSVGGEELLGMLYT